MNIVTTRFGNVRASETQLLRIPEGLVGFRSHTRFVLIPDPESGGLWWLQSATDPETAFALVDPEAVVPEYQLELRPGDRAALELADGEKPRVLVILNRVEGGGLAVNLQGPVVLNHARGIGRQMVLTSNRYAVRYPLTPEANGPADADDAHAGPPAAVAGSAPNRNPAESRSTAPLGVAVAAASARAGNANPAANPATAPARA